MKTQDDHRREPMEMWKEEYDQIPVPQEARDGIEAGIMRAKLEKKRSDRMKNMKRTGVTAAALVLTFGIAVNASPVVAQAMDGIPVIGSIYQGAKSVGGWVADKISGHATGTSFFAGGWTRVNERGGEIMRLPGGTQIIPHDVSQRMAGGRGIQVQVIVQGNVIGNRAYAEELGEIVGQRILRALRNT